MVVSLVVCYVDCKKALALNQSYIKAHIRLVASYMKSNQLQEALSACESGLAIDPSNDQLKSYLSSLVGQNASTGSANSAANPAPNASNASNAGSSGGLGGLSGLLNNPAIREA